MMFGKEVVVKAKPAKTVVKAFAVSSLKKQHLRDVRQGGGREGEASEDSGQGFCSLVPEKTASELQLAVGIATESVEASPVGACLFHCYTARQVEVKDGECNSAADTEMAQPFLGMQYRKEVGLG